MKYNWKEVLKDWGLVFIFLFFNHKAGHPVEESLLGGILLYIMLRDFKGFTNSLNE